MLRLHRRKFKADLFRFVTWGSLLLLIGSSACTESTTSIDNTEPSATPSATPRVVVTRMAALARGVLSEEEGCIRVGNSYLVFPPGQHEVVRKGDTIEVTDVLAGSDVPTTWHLGDTVAVGGGGVRDPSNIPHEPFPDHCEGPYWLVGDIEEP